MYAFNNDLIINIVPIYNEEQIKKIIKIQSNVRGMEIRDKIKLKGKNKQLIKKENIQKTNEFTYEKNISKEIDENDLELNEKFERIIVIKNKYLFYINFYHYSLKMI